MKIGILTFHFAYNYGAMLQAYALQRAIRENGYACEIIDYRPDNINSIYRLNLKALIAYPKRTISIKLKELLSETNFYKFEKFIKEEFVLSNQYNKSRELENMCKYDFVVVGSDQIWNYHITDYDASYLVDFGFYNFNMHKISYAASLGTSEIDERWKKELAKHLQGFASISVREKNSAGIIKELCTNREIEVVLDPIFLISRQHWEDIAEPIAINEEKYILLYLLRKDEQLEEYATRLSEKYKCKIIAIHPLYKICSKCDISLSNIGPKEFLWLIKHAKFVCTNSFHASAFSLLMESKVTIVFDKENGGRIENLINLMQIGMKEIQYMKEKIPYYQIEESSKQILQNQIIKSKLYLFNGIGGN